MKWPRKKSMDKLKDTIRKKTRRTEGRSKANVFEPIDGYTRGRPIREARDQ
jgi:hypothetical protein